jgi:hypothetical protein
MQSNPNIQTIFQTLVAMGYELSAMSFFPVLLQTFLLQFLHIRFALNCS